MSQITILAMTPIDGKCKIRQKNSHFFCASFHRFRDVNILNCYLQKVGESYRVQFLQLHHLMGNVKIYKCHFLHF